MTIGESPIAGYGVDSQEQAITGQLALALRHRSGRAVTWQAHGKDGITAPRVAAADCANGLRHCQAELDSGIRN